MLKVNETKTIMLGDYGPDQEAVSLLSSPD